MMFRAETHRCLEKALARILSRPESRSPVKVAPTDIPLLAETLADQLWLDGYELDPVKRSPAEDNAEDD